MRGRNNSLSKGLPTSEEVRTSGTLRSDNDRAMDVNSVIQFPEEIASEARQSRLTRRQPCRTAKTIKKTLPMPRIKKTSDVVACSRFKGGHGCRTRGHGSQRWSWRWSGCDGGLGIGRAAGRHGWVWLTHIGQEWLLFASLGWFSFNQLLSQFQRPIRWNRLELGAQELRHATASECRPNIKQARAARQPMRLASQARCSRQGRALRRKDASRSPGNGDYAGDDEQDFEER